MQNKITIHVTQENVIDPQRIIKKEADKYALELNDEAGRRGLSRPDFWAKYYFHRKTA